LFPMMSEEELQSLAEDIKANGLLHRIIIDNENQIVDGRNRLAACKLANVEPRFEQLNGQDSRGVIVSANLNRRNLSARQRTMAYAFIYREPERLKRRSSAAEHQDVTKSGLSEARKVLRTSPALGKEVLLGQRTLDQAYEQVQRQERESEQRKSELARLHKEAPNLAAKVEEGKLKLEEATAQLSERMQQMCDYREGGRQGVQALANYPAMITLIHLAIDAGASNLLSEELVEAAEEATKNLRALWQSQSRRQPL